jgi:hypothetical protein
MQEGGRSESVLVSAQVTEMSGGDGDEVDAGDAVTPVSVVRNSEEGIELGILAVPTPA